MPSPAPPSFPIATAPKVPNEELLLWDREFHSWVIGFWDGDGWFCEAGPRLDPTARPPRKRRPG